MSSLFSNDICRCYVICVFDSFVDYILILSQVTLTRRFLQFPSLFIIFVYLAAGVLIAVKVLRSVYCDRLRNSTTILFNFANCTFTIEFNSSSLIPDFFVSFYYSYFLCHTSFEVLTAALFWTMQRLVQILIPLDFWNVIARHYYFVEKYL